MTRIFLGTQFKILVHSKIEELELKIERENLDLNITIYLRLSLIFFISGKFSEEIRKILRRFSPNVISEWFDKAKNKPGTFLIFQMIKSKLNEDKTSRKGNIKRGMLIF